MNRFTFYRNIPAVLLSCLMVALLATSCKKDAAEDTSAPVITAVTTTVDYTDSLHTAALNDWVMIHGKHLAIVSTVMFNLLTVADSAWYANDTTITVKIPAKLADSINNLITVKTKYGTATYGFVIKLSAPLYATVTPGIAAAGETVTISGSYFNTVKSVLFGTTAAIIVASTDSTVQVKVPAGANGQYITVTTAGGSVTSTNMFGANYVLYDDALNALWWNGGWSGTTTLGTTDQVLRGSSAVTRTSDAWGALEFGGGPVDVTGYKAVKVSVYGGAGTGGKLVKLILNGNAGAGQTLSITEGKWATYTILLSNLGSPTSLSDIWLQEFSGTGGLTIYIDDMVLL